MSLAAGVTAKVNNQSPVPFLRLGGKYTTVHLGSLARLASLRVIATRKEWLSVCTISALQTPDQGLRVANAQQEDYKRAIVQTRNGKLKVVGDNTNNGDDNTNNGNDHTHNGKYGASLRARTGYCPASSRCYPSHSTPARGRTIRGTSPEARTITLPTGLGVGQVQKLASQ